MLGRMRQGWLEARIDSLVKESGAEKGLELVGGVFNGGKFWGESGEEGSGGTGGGSGCSPVATDGGFRPETWPGTYQTFCIRVCDRESFKREKIFPQVIFNYKVYILLMPKTN